MWPVPTCGATTQCRRLASPEDWLKKTDLLKSFANGVAVSWLLKMLAPRKIPARADLADRQTKNPSVRIESENDSLNPRKASCAFMASASNVEADYLLAQLVERR